MAKFIFRLQSFLTLKEKLEDQKKMDYGRAMAELERERAKLREIEGEKAMKVGEFTELAKGTIEPVKFTRYNLYIEVLKQRIIEQKKAVAKAEQIAEEKRLILVEAMKERKALQTLKDKNFEEFKEEEKRAEQRMVDEVVSFRFNAKKSAQAVSEGGED
jgi:flagellar FliJ protein